MRKKITMLLASLFACVGVMKAAVTDLPQMTTSTDDIKWYTISNTRSTSGKYLYWTESGVKDANAKKLSSLFYFTGTAEECYIHNAATNLLIKRLGLDFLNEQFKEIGLKDTHLERLLFDAESSAKGILRL